MLFHNCLESLRYGPIIMTCSIFLFNLSPIWFYNVYYYLLLHVLLYTHTHMTKSYCMCKVNALIKCLYFDCETWVPISVHSHISTTCVPADINTFVSKWWITLKFKHIGTQIYNQYYVIEFFPKITQCCSDLIKSLFLSFRSNVQFEECHFYTTDCIQCEEVQRINIKIWLNILKVSLCIWMKNTYIHAIPNIF